MPRPPHDHDDALPPGTTIIEPPPDIPPDPAPSKPTTGMQDPEYRKKRRKTKHPFNFEINDTRRLQLRKVADTRGISMGATLRQLIAAAYTMDVDHKPVCASGRACFMPHMHPHEPVPCPEEEPTL